MTWLGVRTTCCERDRERAPAVGKTGSKHIHHRVYAKIMARTNQKVRYPPESKVRNTPGDPREDWSADAAEEDVMRFSELERAIPLASQKMLIQQLRDLEAKGVVTRTIYQEIPPKVEYKLTELGKALRPALRELVQWTKLRRQVHEHIKS